MYNAKYSLDNEGGVKLEFTAMVTAPTPVNLANHVYFNLAGHQTGSAGKFFLKRRPKSWLHLSKQMKALSKTLFTNEESFFGPVAGMDTPVSP